MIDETAERGICLDDGEEETEIRPWRKCGGETDQAMAMVRRR
jgi:hypothetical protein